MKKYLLITVWSGIFALLWVTIPSALFFDFENQDQLDQWEVLIPPNDPENDQDASWQIVNGSLKLKTGRARGICLHLKILSSPMERYNTNSSGSKARNL